MLQAGRSRVRIRWGGFFQFTSSLQPHYGPGVDPASNRNEYEGSSWGVEGGRRVGLTSLPPSMCRLSRENVGASTSHNSMGLHGLLKVIALPFLLELSTVRLVESVLIEFNAFIYFIVNYEFFQNIWHCWEQNWNISWTGLLINIHDVEMFLLLVAEILYNLFPRNASLNSCL
jgi:hypothetical protein